MSEVFHILGEERGEPLSQHGVMCQWAKC